MQPTYPELIDGDIYLARFQQQHHRTQPFIWQPNTAAHQYWTPSQLNGWNYDQSFGGFNMEDCQSAFDCMIRMRQNYPSFKPRLRLIVGTGPSTFDVVWAEEGGWIDQPDDYGDYLEYHDGDKGDLTFWSYQVGVAPPQVNAPPEMHIDPLEAAKRVRVLAREIRELAQDNPLSDSRMGVISVHATDAKFYLTHMGTQFETFDQILSDLDHAIKNRKVTAGRSAMIRLRENVRTMKGRQDAALSRTVRVQETAAGAGPSSSQVRLVELVDELHVNAQAIPTHRDANITPAEHVLHAMYVVMRNNGYAKEAEDATADTSQVEVAD